MRKMTFAKKIMRLLMLSIIFTACEDNFDKHYEIPDWLKGSVWEVLESRGDFSIFLKGIELSGYQPIVEGKNILTVMAPNDDSFKAYFAQKGISSIEDMSTEEVKKLIGYHLMYYSYSPEKLINYRTEGDDITEEEKEVAAGLNFKYRTRSSDANSLELDPETNEYVTVYHQERFLPVFSYKLFNTKKINASYNYEYFYPNSTWTGDTLFNISNASVEESGIIADNGYVYVVNQVLEPLETIYKTLEGLSEFSTFLELYDQYKYFELDEELTVEYGNGVDLYLFKHEDPLPSIACEWINPYYWNLSVNSALAYGVFAPSNSAISSFADEYWNEYSSILDVSPIAITYLLYNCFYNSSIVFPEEIQNGEIINRFESEINFDVESVPEQYRKMCVNGTFYGLSQLEPPAMFYSITGPAFRHEKYSYYLDMLDASGFLVAFSDAGGTFTALFPSNEQLETRTIERIDDVLYEETVDGFEEMKTSSKLEYVNLHTVTGTGEINSSGTQVLITNTSFKYWFIKDFKITVSTEFNKLIENPTQSLDPFVQLTELTYNGEAWSNGKAYSYAGDTAFTYSDNASFQRMLAMYRSSNYSFYRFGELLRDAGIADLATGQINILVGNRALIFIPTNTAILNAIAAGRIPGVVADASAENGYYNVTDEDALSSYLKSYFVLTSDNGILTYPFIGSTTRGAYTNLAETSLNIIDSGSKLSVQLEGGSIVDVISDYDYFPFAYEDGGVHFIEDVL